MNAVALYGSVLLLAQDAGSSDSHNLDLVIKVVGALLSAGTAASVAWYIAGRGYRDKIRHYKKKAEHYQELHTDAAAEREQQGALAIKLQQEFAEATAKLTELTGRYAAVLKVGHQWKARAQQLEVLVAKCRRELARLGSLSTELTTAKGQLEGQVTGLSTDLSVRQAAIEKTEARMRRALKLEGQLWAAKALQSRPKFRDLAWRQRAVVSVLNLKGGVGKTTITAHLGAALARRGYRVLVIDLDLQGSLTSMLLPQAKISHLYADGKLLQHFFNRAAEDKTTKITGYAQPVLQVHETGGSLGIVGTTDALAYSELNLTMRWLLHSGRRDTRFLLRKALHLISVGNDYDIVLLDCPPLINISCVNALAASDYLLVPTTLSQKSLERVPLLLKRVLRSEKFLRHINHELRVLGLVANRTWRDELSAGEKDDWDRLATRCKDVYGQEVRRLLTIIPQQNKEIRDSESEFGLPDPDSRLAAVFSQLATEIEKELPSECRRLAKAHP